STAPSAAAASKNGARTARNRPSGAATSSGMIPTGSFLRRGARPALGGAGARGGARGGGGGGPRGGGGPPRGGRRGGGAAARTRRGGPVGRAGERGEVDADLARRAAHDGALVAVGDLEGLRAVGTADAQHRGTP